jgi:hypothetical protein
MATAKESIETADATRRKVFIVVGLATALLVALLVFWATRPRPRNDRDVQPQLAGALRAGAPEFEQLRQKIVVDFVPDQDASENGRLLGDITMDMKPKVRNFTGRTITGLELQATVVDLENKPVQTKTVIAIPRLQPALEPNKVIEVLIHMEGFKKEDVRANIRIDVTGVIVK